MPTQVAVLDPDGNPGYMPSDVLAQHPEFKPATRVTDKDGNAGWMPRENVARAIKEEGFTVGQPPTSVEASPSRPLTDHTQATWGGIGNIATGAKNAVTGFVDTLKAPESVGEGIASAIPGGLAGYRAIRSAIETAKSVPQVPGAIRDIADNPQGALYASKVVGETAGGVAVQAALGKATETAGSPTTETAARVAGKVGKGLVEDIPGVRQVLKLGKYAEEAAKETAARRAPGPAPTYPGAPLPEDPGTFPGANLPEAPSKAALQARALEKPGAAPPPEQSAALGNAKFPQYDKTVPVEETAPKANESATPEANAHPDAAEFEKKFDFPLSSYLDEAGKFDKHAFLNDIVKPRTEPPAHVMARHFGADSVPLIEKLTGEPLKMWESTAPEGAVKGGSARLRAKQEVKSVATNGSGESSASQEAINRASSDRRVGVKYYRIDTRSGVETPIIGADALDTKAGPYDEIIRRGPDGETTLDAGRSARRR